MSIEKGRSKSIDGQWIRDNETKEFKYEYSRGDDVKPAYQKVVERLALNKIKNELLFNGMLEAQLRAFDKDGIIISRQQLIDDINREVARQRVSFDLGNEVSLELPKVDIQPSEEQSQIDRLKNNLGSIFGGTVRNENATLEEQKLIDTPVVTTDEPITEKTLSTEQIVPQFNSQIEREEYFDEMYDSEIHKLTELKKNNDPNYEIELNNSIKKISSFTDRIPNVRDQIEIDIKYQLDRIKRENVQNQEQQNKDSLINGILQRMTKAGEFSHIPLEDVSQRVDAMNMVKKRLQEKSIDELEIIFNSYTDQEEKIVSSGMRR